MASVRLTSGPLPQGRPAPKLAGDRPKHRRAPTQELDLLAGTPCSYFLTLPVQSRWPCCGPSQCGTSWYVRGSFVERSCLSEVVELCACLLLVPRFRVCARGLRLWSRLGRALVVPFTASRRSLQVSILCGSSYRRGYFCFSWSHGRSFLRRWSHEVLTDMSLVEFQVLMVSVAGSRLLP